MVRVRDVLRCMDEAAPFYMKLDFDNIGLMVGDPAHPVTRVLVALDATEAVIAEAEAFGAELIVTHHPLIFHPLRSVSAADGVGRRVMRLVRSDTAVLSFHTNLDSAEGGVNDALMEALGGRVTGLLAPHGTHPDGTPYGIARLGELPEALSVEAFLERVRKALNCAGLRYVAGDRPIRKLACCGGAGGGELGEVLAAGCDAYVTADLKYDQYLSAQEAGLTLIDADHFCTENVVVPKLRELLSSRFPELEVRIAERLGQTVRAYP